MHTLKFKSPNRQSTPLTKVSVCRTNSIKEHPTFLESPGGVPGSSMTGNFIVQLGDFITPLDNYYVGAHQWTGQVEEFKCLGVFFKSERKIEQAINRWINAYAVLICCSEKNNWAKRNISVYWTNYVPNLTCGHELWLVSEWKRFCIEVANMSFFHRVGGRGAEELRSPGGTQWAASHSHQKNPMEVAWTSLSDVSTITP